MGCVIPDAIAIISPSLFLRFVFKSIPFVKSFESSIDATQALCFEPLIVLPFTWRLTFTSAIFLLSMLLEPISFIILFSSKILIIRSFCFIESPFPASPATIPIPVKKFVFVG